MAENEICKACGRPVADSTGLCAKCQKIRDAVLKEEAEEREAREARQDLTDRNRTYTQSALSERARKP